AADMAECAIRASGIFFVQAEDGIRGVHVTGVQTCALPISNGSSKREGYDSWWETRMMNPFRFLIMQFLWRYHSKNVTTGEICPIYDRQWTRCLVCRRLAETNSDTWLLRNQG